MSYTPLIDCDNKDNYDIETIFRELLVWDDEDEQYKLRTA